MGLHPTKTLGGGGSSSSGGYFGTKAQRIAVIRFPGRGEGFSFCVSSYAFSGDTGPSSGMKSVLLQIISRGRKNINIKGQGVSHPDNILTVEDLCFRPR